MALLQKIMNMKKNYFTLLAILFALLLNSLHANAQVSNALNFDGSNDRVNISPVIPYTSNFTVEGWIKTTGGLTPPMFCWGNSVVNGYVLVGENNGKFRFSIGNGATLNQFDGVSTISNNAWHHIAVTKFGNQVKMYVDGFLENSPTTNLTPATITSTMIGAGLLNGSIQGFFPGSIDEVRIWSIARTQTEIQTNMNCELSAQAGLVAAYHFNQGIAGGNNAGVTSLTDASGNNHTGALLNFALTGATSNWIASGVLLPATLPVVANTSICAGATVTLSILSGNLNTATAWKWYTGSCGTTLVGIGPTLSVNPLSTTTYYVRGEGSCASSIGPCALVTVTVNPLPTPTISASGPTTFCAGGNVNLTATGGVAYSWSTGATTSTINVNTSGTYTVTVTNASGCATPVTQTVNVNPIPSTPIINANGSTTQCVGSTLNLTATSIGGATFSWTTAEIAPTITVSTTGNYGVVATSAAGCQSQFSFINVIFNPLSTYYQDADGDGFGNLAVDTVICGVAPGGFISNNTDCDDNNAGVHQNCGVCNLLMTDGTWKSAPANPALATGWEQAGYDDSGWSNAVELAPDGGLINFPTPPLGIWDADHSSFPNRTYLRKTFALNNANHMIFEDSVDDDAIIYINGVFVTQDNDCSSGTHYGIDVTSYLNLNGSNTIAVLASDCGGGYTFAAQLYNGYYADNDGDGFGSNIAVAFCNLGQGLASNHTDCDDTNPNIYPGAIEIPNNGIDEDCNGSDLIANPAAALNFDGVDDYVAIPNGGGLNNLQSGTIEMWVKWNGTNQAASGNIYGPITGRQANFQFSNQVIALDGPNPNIAKIVCTEIERLLKLTL